MRAPSGFRIVSLATSLSALTALASGCALAMNPDDLLRDRRIITEAEVDDYNPGFEIPVGSHIERPGEVPPGDIGDGHPEGSIRPDDRTPSERIPEIVRRGRIIVGVDQSQYLLSYRNPQNGEFTGFEIDLAKEISRDIFGDPSRVDYRFIDSASRTEALKAGEVDMVIRTMSVTEKRQETMAFSTPYLRASARLLVPSDSTITGTQDLGGKTVCVAEGATSVDLMRTHGTSENILVVRNWADCLMALQQNLTDAILSDDTILSGMNAQDSYTKIVGEELTDDFYAVTMAKPSPTNDTTGLIMQVNSTIERIRADGTWQRMYADSLGGYLPPASPPPLHYRDEEEDS